MSEHTLTGNCWENVFGCKICGKGVLCDVCHAHEQERGNCTECAAACQACQEQGLDPNP